MKRTSTLCFAATSPELRFVLFDWSSIQFEGILQESIVIQPQDLPSFENLKMSYKYKYLTLTPIRLHAWVGSSAFYSWEPKRPKPFPFYALVSTFDRNILLVLFSIFSNRTYCYEITLDIQCLAILFYALISTFSGQGPVNFPRQLGC